MKIKKAKTEVGTTFNEKDTEIEDVECQPQKIFSLKDNGAFSKFKQLQSAFKTVALKDKVLISTPIGPNSILNSEDILMENDNSGQTKNLQGQGSSSGSYSQLSHEETSESLEDIAKTLDTLQVWNDIEKMVKLKSFKTITFLVPSRDLFISFLVQSCALIKFPDDFAPALAFSYKWLTNNGIQINRAITKEYARFFQQFKPHKSHTVQDLRILYKFCRIIEGSVHWIKQVKDAQLLVADVAALKGCCTVARLLFECKSHYSHAYFNLVDYIMENAPLTVPNVKGFVQMIKLPNVLVDTPWIQIFEQYAGIENTYHKQQVFTVGGQIFGVCTKPTSCSLLMSIVELAITLKKCEDIKTVLQSQFQFSTFKEFNNILNLQQEKNNLKKQEVERQKQMKEKEQEENKIVAGQEQERLQELEEQKKKKAEEKQIKEESRKYETLKVYHELCDLNAVAPVVDESFLEFAEKMTYIAGQLPEVLIKGVPTTIVPRAEQLAAMYLLLNSQRQRALIQLATGTGKSLMLGILAQQLNQTTRKKVIVVVPTSFLHAYQQYHYCPAASKVPEDMADPNIKQIFYSDFNRFLASDFAVPIDTILLVDEFHELFFDQRAELVNGKVVSVISKLFSAAKVIGVSATYRGEAGIKKISQIFHKSMFIKPPQQLQDKELQLEVFGRVPEEEIIPRAVVLAQEKAKEMPVIIFCSDPLAIQKQLPEALVFTGDEVGELNELLKFLKTSSNAIVLTTSADSKGVDFVFATPQAFVIHTVLPKSLVQLKQDSGRGVRGNDMPIIGALFTAKMYFTLQGVELGLSHAEQFDKLYPADYIKSLQFLEKLPTPSTEPQCKALEAAINALNSGKSFSQICSVLSKLPAFKKILPKFAIPAPPKQMLGKRSPPLQRHNDIKAFLKRRNVQLVEGQDLPENWTELEQEWENEQEDEVEMQQPAGELSQAVVEDLERQQYQALHAKFSGSGKQQASDSGTASPQSKTSSQVLGLDRASESSLGIHRKKREQKKHDKYDEDEHQERQQEQEQEHSPPPQSPAAATNNANKRREQKEYEKESVAGSEKSNRSKWSSNRSTKTGEYPCTAPDCGKMFTTAQLRSQHKNSVHNLEGKKKKQEANKKQ